MSAKGNLINILWVGNYTSNSGYAIQARLFVRRIQNAGHKVTVFEVGATGSPRIIDGIQVIPTYQDPLGNDMVAEHFSRLRADVTISLIDAWGLRPDAMRNLNWYPIAPIDHAPVPPSVAASLSVATRPIAITRFGVEQMRNAGFSPYYIPHAFDGNTYFPASREAARQALSVPQDAYFVVFVGVNDSVPSRKGIPELLAAWQGFSAAHPDAMLYMHTSPLGNLASNPTLGVNIPEIMRQFGVKDSRIVMPDDYFYKTGFASSYMANVYNAADVLVLPTRGEGFGIPLIEAQACGTPVITTDFAAGAELCASGWKIEAEPDWTWQNAMAMKPSISSIFERLNEAYASRRDPRYRQQAREFALQYEVNTVFSSYMEPVLREMSDGVMERMA